MDLVKRAGQLKPSYFDGTLFPRTVVLSEPLSKALRDARH